MISSPSLASIFLCSSPTLLSLLSFPHPYLDLLPLPSLCPISPPLPRLVLSSSFPVSLSSIPASFCQFQILAKAVVRRLDAYCCYRNLPSALDYNVTLSLRQGYNVCSFLCLTRYTPGYLLFVCTVRLSVCLTVSVFSCHWYMLLVILMSSVACSHTFKLQYLLTNKRSKPVRTKFSSYVKWTITDYLYDKAQINDTWLQNACYTPRAVICRGTCYDWVWSMGLNLLNFNLWAFSRG